MRSLCISMCSPPTLSKQFFYCSLLPGDFLTRIARCGLLSCSRCCTGTRIERRRLLWRKIRPHDTKPVLVLQEQALAVRPPNLCAHMSGLKPRRVNPYPTRKPRSPRQEYLHTMRRWASRNTHACTYKTKNSYTSETLTTSTRHNAPVAQTARELSRDG